MEDNDHHAANLNNPKNPYEYYFDAHRKIQTNLNLTMNNEKKVI